MEIMKQMTKKRLLAIISCVVIVAVVGTLVGFVRVGGGQWPLTNAPLAVAKGAPFFARAKLRLPEQIKGPESVLQPLPTCRQKR